MLSSTSVDTAAVEVRGPRKRYGTDNVPHGLGFTIRHPEDPVPPGPIAGFVQAPIPLRRMVRQRA